MTVAVIESSSPRLANTTTADVQESPSVTALTGGGFVVTWEDNSDSAKDFQIKGQVFNAAGDKVGGEFTVNTTANGPQYFSSVTALDGGGFAVTWQDIDEGGGDPVSGVLAQRFNATGHKVGKEIKVAGGDAGDSDIAKLKGGGFIVTWSENDDIFAQRYNAGGKTVGSTITVTDDAGIQDGARVTGLSDGRFAIVYEDHDSGNIVVVGYGKNGDRHTTFGFTGGFNVDDPDIVATTGNHVVAAFTDTEFADRSDGRSISLDSPAPTNPLQFGDNFAKSQFNHVGLAALGGEAFVAVEVATDQFNDQYLFGHLFLDGVNEDEIYNTAGDDQSPGFYLGTGLDGDQNDVSVAGLKNGDIVAAFHDTSHSGNDTTGAIRYQILKTYNVVPGGGGSETLEGTKARDYISGLVGDDTLNGGDGDDILAGGADEDHLNGGKGSDTASYVNAEDNVVVDLLNPNLNTHDAAGDTYTSIENVTGSLLGDFINGTGKANRISGWYGDDWLTGRAGADFLDGGYGEDIANYLTGAEKSGVVADLVFGGSKGDAKGDIYVSIEDIIGSNFDDTLKGDAGDNKLFGSAGDDVLEGRGGADALYGDDEAGDGDLGIDAVSYASAGAGVVVVLYDPGYNTGDAVGDTYFDIEDVIGSKFADTIYAGNNGIAHRLFGGDGDDELVGGDKGDTFDGGNGSDTASYDNDGGFSVLADLLTRANNTGYASGDKYVSIENLIGTSWSDGLYGDNGNNLIRGGNTTNSAKSVGDDYFDGRGGNDKLVGYGGIDTLIGGAGRDILVGGGSGDFFKFERTTDSAVGKNHDIIADFFGSKSQGDRIDVSAIDADKSTKAVNEAFAYIASDDFNKVKGELRWFFDDDFNVIVQGDVDGDGKADFEIFLELANSLSEVDFVL